MAKLVLRLRGWQVFAILQGAIVVSVIVWWRSVRVGVGASEHSWLSIVLASVELLAFGWMLSLGATMNSYLPPVIRRGWVFPSVGLGVVVVYLLLAGPTIAGERAASPAMWLLLVPVHLFAMAVNFYLLWYVSRGVVAVEVRGKPPLDRVLGIFFALWLTLFVPVGAWWVQSRARLAVR